MTRSELKLNTRRELADLARDQRIEGWHGMKKHELVEALAAVYRRNRSRNRRNGTGKHDDALGEAAPSHGSPRPSIAGESQMRSERGRCRLPATPACDLPDDRRRDRLAVVAHGPYWINARWVLSNQILDRAEAAMGTEWRQAVPTLRVFHEGDVGRAATTQVHVGDVDVSQPIGEWFVPVPEPGRFYRLQLGYRAPSGNFFVLAQSARVKTPRAGTFPAAPENPHGAAHARYGLESRNGDSQRRDDEAPAVVYAPRNGGAHPAGSRERNGNADIDCDFHIDAEITIYGKTHPAAQLALMGEPVRPERDGTFSLRLALDEGRHVFPAECIDPNGARKRTIVLAVERNTKHLDPVSLDELI